MADTIILEKFKSRMDRLGIQVEYAFNFPFIYVASVDGRKVKQEDYHLGNHGFTIAFYPTRGQEMEITNTRKLFQLIRKYKKN
jgi:hypothetical protein